MASSLVDSDIGVDLVPGASVSSNSLTVSGTDRYLLVIVLSSEGTPLSPNAVKWGGSGGTTMSHVGSTLDVGSFEKLDLYELVAPSATTSTVYVSWAASQDEKILIALAFDGVDQSTPTRTVATGTGSSLAPSATATSVSGDLVIGMAGFLDLSAGSLTLTATETSIQEVEGPTLTYHGLGAESKTATTTSTAMAWTISGGVAKDWGAFALALIASSGAVNYPLYQKPNNASRFIFNNSSRGSF